LPAPAGLGKALLVTLPLAIRVFAAGAYRDWQQQRRGSLGARICYAANAGVIWWRAWWSERKKRRGW